MGRMVQVAAPTAPEDGLPAKLRDEILARACKLLPEVLHHSASYVEKRYKDIDRAPGTGRERAVSDLPEREIALKRSAARLAVREALRALQEANSPITGPEAIRLTFLLRSALIADEHLDKLIPTAQIQSEKPLLGIGRDATIRDLTVPVKGGWYA